MISEVILTPEEFEKLSDEEKEEHLTNLHRKVYDYLVNESTDMDPEMQKVVDDHFWELM